MDFETALVQVLRHEGGYSNHTADPGGPTNYGITQATARDHGYMGAMASIPLHIVRDIYQRSYWNRGRCEDLPGLIRLIHFDSCVNSGTGRAAKWLQEAVSAVPDGIIGPKTLAAAHNADPVETLEKYAQIRLAFLQRLSTFKTFGRGWTNRVNAVVAYSKGLIR